MAALEYRHQSVSLFTPWKDNALWVASVCTPSPSPRGLGVCAQAQQGLQGVSVRSGRGCPGLVPDGSAAAAVPGIAEPVSEAGCTSVELCMGNGKILPGSKGNVWGKVSGKEWGTALRAPCVGRAGGQNNTTTSKPTQWRWEAGWFFKKSCKKRSDNEININIIISSILAYHHQHREYLKSAQNWSWYISYLYRLFLGNWDAKGKLDAYWEDVKIEQAVKPHSHSMKKGGMRGSNFNFVAGSQDLNKGKKGQF